MEDLSRFFRQLVRNLAAINPDRVRHPLPLGEIRETILPYRANRRALQLESSEDYELVFIRLCAGEGGFARMEPDNVHSEFAAEAGSSNPDLSIVHRHENAVLILNQEHLVRALDVAPERAFAPPDQRYAPPAPLEPAAPPQPVRPKASSEQTKDPSTAICRACGGKLPRGPDVKFCPHCGEGQGWRYCHQCETELDPAWRHCVNCGSPVKRV